jgi:hypothetical protein
MKKNRIVATAADTNSTPTETLAIMFARYISLRKINGIMILLYEFYLKIIKYLTYMKAGKKCE